MNLINWINGVTKLSKATMDAFQDNIKDAVDGLQDDIDAIESKTNNFNTYYSAWSSSITFYVPSGRHALLMTSFNAVYLVWNANDQVNYAPIYGSGVSFSRDSSDTTKITATRSSNATWTVVVF